MQDRTVQEMWDSNFGWEMEEFMDYFPASVLKEIAAHEVFFYDETVDEVYWNDKPLWGFYLRSAIDIIRNKEEVIRRKLLVEKKSGVSQIRNT